MRRDCAHCMDEDHPKETLLEQARRYAREAEERVTRLVELIALVRAIGKPVDDLERLLDQYNEWLALARTFEENVEKEAARNKPPEAK